MVLNQRCDYYLHGLNKDDAVPSHVSYFSLPRHPNAIRRRHRVVCLTFCLPAGCTEGLLFLDSAYHPNIYMRNHNCTAWEGKHPRPGCKIAALLASVIVPKLLSPTPSLALGLCVWQDGLFEPLCLCFLMMSRAGFGWAQASGANSECELDWPVEDGKPGTDVPNFSGLRSRSHRKHSAPMHGDLL